MIRNESNNFLKVQRLFGYLRFLLIIKSFLKEIPVVYHSLELIGFFLISSFP